MLTINFMNFIDTKYYFLLTYFLTFVLLYFALFSRRQVNISIFLILLVVLFFLCRVFVILFNRQLNPDESQMITQALTLREYPIVWKSVDPTTGGPLLSYMLILPTFFGFGFDYINAHFLAAVYLAGAMVFTFLAAKNWYGPRVAQISILPVLIILSFTINAEFLHYSSELLSILLISIALYFYSAITLQAKQTKLLCFLTGLFLGCVPFAKLQAAPIGFVVGLFVLIEVIRFQHSYSKALFLIIGSLTFPLLFCLFLGLNGALDNMITFYIKGNLSYDHSYMSNTGRLIKFLYVSFNLEKSISLYLLLLLPALSILTQFIPKKYPVLKNRHLIFLTLYLFSCIYSIAKSGAFFPHDYQFLFFTGTIVYAYFIHIIFKNSTRSFAVVQAGLIIVVIVIIKQGPGFNYEMRINNSMTSTDYGLGHSELKNSEIAQVIKRYSSAEDFIVIWGWGSDYYVEAQRMQGTMLNHRDFSTDLNLPHARAQYVSDIARTRPKVFIDINHREDEQEYIYEKFPALKQYVDAHYNFYGKVEKARIFIRKDVPFVKKPEPVSGS